MLKSGIIVRIHAIAIQIGIQCVFGQCFPWRLIWCHFKSMQIQWRIVTHRRTGHHRYTLHCTIAQFSAILYTNAQENEREQELSRISKIHIECHHPLYWMEYSPFLVASAISFELFFSCLCTVYFETKRVSLAARGQSFQLIVLSLKRPVVDLHCNRFWNETNDQAKTIRSFCLMWSLWQRDVERESERYWFWWSLTLYIENWLDGIGW